MKVKGSGRRVLRFAVTGALLSAGPACDSGKKDGTTSPDDSKPREYAPNPGPQDAKDSADGGVQKKADPAPVDDPKVEENVNVQPVEEPLPVEPDRVNTQKVEEPEPPEPREPKEPKYVNTRRIEEPKPLPKKPEPKRVNTAKEPDPEGL